MRFERRRRHGAFGIEQMIIARSQAELDQSARVGNFFRLPTLVILIASHGLFAGLVPFAADRSAEVVLADEGLLNRGRAFRINLLLATEAFGLFLPTMFGPRSRAYGLCGCRGMSSRSLLAGCRRAIGFISRTRGTRILLAGRRRWKGAGQRQRANRAQAPFANSDPMQH